MSSVLRSRWILPIDQPPIPDGWIEISRGRVVSLGAGRPPSPATDLGDVAVLPGLVNAHTHLELSWMAGRIEPSDSMDAWIRRLVDVRRTGAPGGREVERAAADGAASMRASGTVLAGDISNTAMTPAVLAEAGLGGTVFHELLGFNHVDPASAVREAWARVDQDESPAAHGGVRIDRSVVAHAPYSVSPALFRAIATVRRGAPLSIHLAESPEEIEFLRTGRGPFRELLESLGVWTDAWTVPACGPVQYIADLGYLQPGTIVVHGVYLTDDELDRLREAGAILVTCPRSNLWVGSGTPRIAHFYGAGLPVAIGTDSLASVDSLSLFDELAEIRRLAPEVSAGRLLESATRIGAEALGQGADFGTIAAGKRAALVGVAVPAGTTDVEEYLVSGVPPNRIQRVDLTHVI